MGMLLVRVRAGAEDGLLPLSLHLRYNHNYEEANKGCTKKARQTALRRQGPAYGRSDAQRTAEVEAWAAANDTTRSNAIRRLVELGLKAKGK